jgi:predicted O-linked N-acetylglucosamine transferase (SPINDLY family)
VLREQNEPEKAVDAFERASALDGANLQAAMGSALMLPPVYDSTHDLLAWRRRYGEGLATLLARADTWRRCSRQILDVEWTNFYLAYQGCDDREFQGLYSDFVASLLHHALPGFQSPTRFASRHDGRIHVGFVSSNFRICTVGDYFVHWVTDLPRDRFHVSVFHLGHISDARTSEFRACADTFVRVNGNADAVASTIRAHAVDALVYPDVGMTALSTALSNLRLAPLQLAAWGHPVTTGSRFVDGYISCTEMEPPAADTHYRERLVLLPGIGVRYRAPVRKGHSSIRARLALAEHVHVYLCPHSLYKIHPETDAMLVDILERDADAVLVFVAAMTQGQTSAFVRRISGELSARRLPRRNQIKVLPMLPRTEFLDVMATSDVMLDGLHWTGGNTSLDALSSNLPIVTLRGAHMRGRQSAAMLEIVGVPDLIAADRSDYVRLALRLAADTAFRDGIVIRIREGKARLFDQRGPVPALAQAIEACCRNARLTA